VRFIHITRASITAYHFLVPLIKEQERRGHYVCVCTSDDAHAQKLRDSGIDCFGHRLERSLDPWVLRREIVRIAGILREQKIDAAVCHTPLGAGVGRIAARRAGTAHVVYFCHGLPCAPGQNILKWSIGFCLEKALARLTDAIIVMNTYDENLCRKHKMTRTGDRVFRIPGMGVNLKEFDARADGEEGHCVRHELGIPDTARIVLCTAALIPEKGVFVLLDAARRICARRGDVYFLLCGNGPCADRLGRRAEQFALKEKFRLLGWRDDIPRLMRCADLFTLPTYYFEGLPVSILEAMACGKPVVATKHRGCEDTVVDGATGFLVGIRNPDDLAGKIGTLLDDTSLRDEMGQAGRKRVEEHFEIGQCTTTIVEVLEQACHRGER